MRVMSRKQLAGDWLPIRTLLEASDAMTGVAFAAKLSIVDIYWPHSLSLSLFHCKFFCLELLPTHRMIGLKRDAVSQ